MIPPWQFAASYSLMQVAVLATASLLAAPFVRRWDWRPIGLLLIFVVVDTALQVVPFVYGWEFGSWNWVGKIASILFSLLVVYRFNISNEVGWRWPRGREQMKWSTLGIAGCIIWPFVSHLLTPNTARRGFELFAFEATLPGLDEELSFRGIGLMLLIRAYAAHPIDRRARISAMMVTIVWFTAVHVLEISHGYVLFKWDRVLDVAPFALWVTLIRLRSGSLFVGIIGHNISNVLLEALSTYGRL